MMRYIFEDSENSVLSKFFRICCPDVSDKFHYSGGNTRLLRKSKEVINNYNDDIIIFMDIVPGNYDIRATYNKLITFAKSEECTVDMYIIPIVCSEFYIIEMLYKQFNVKNEFTEMVVTRGKYWNLQRYVDYVKDRIRNHEPRRNSFEGFCKYVLEFHVMDCMVIHESGASEKYYSVDCDCCEQHNSNITSLNAKSLYYVSLYPVFPYSELIRKSMKTNCVTDIKAKIKSLIDEFNNWSDYYKSVYDINSILDLKIERIRTDI